MGNWYRAIVGWFGLLIQLLSQISNSLFKMEQIMSAIKDAADAVKAAIVDLGSAVDVLGQKVDAVVEALKAGNPQDIADAVAELTEAKDVAVAAKASADESAQNITDALPPSA